MRLIDGTRYTPPANGQPAQWNMACFSPTPRIATPRGLRTIGNLRKGDTILTADAGPLPILNIPLICTNRARYCGNTLRQ